MSHSSARLLGVAGLIPFLALTLAGAFGTQAWQLDFGRGLVTYGAVIASFLGGITWGTALRHNNSRLYLLSIVPFLAAWFALLLPTELGLFLLAATLLIALVNDLAMHRAGLLPDWFLSLRKGLTAIVVTSLVLAGLLA